MAQTVKNLPAAGWKDPLEKGMNGNPLQYSCLENSMDRGTWWATAHGIGAQRVMTERLTLSSLEQASLAEIWICLFPYPPPVECKHLERKSMSLLLIVLVSASRTWNNSDTRAICLREKGGKGRRRDGSGGGNL